MGSWSASWRRRQVSRNCWLEIATWDTAKLRMDIHFVLFSRLWFMIAIVLIAEPSSSGVELQGWVISEGGA